MPDRVKVDEWARDFIAYIDELDIARDDYRGIMEYIDDALALLKGQTAQWIWDRPHHFRCSACGNNWGLVSMKMRYCPDCGRRMFLSKTELRKEWPDA